MIHNFYKKHEVITQNQYGFQSGKSTTELLSKFTDEVNTYLNDRKHVLVLFIDFSRAFDTLNHNLLITKLENSGIRGPLIRWCQNYLHNRKFTVKVNDTFSDYKTVTEGTAQGSVLGPLHFLSYVNDMSNCVKFSTCYQFADDTCFIVADKDPQKAGELLQHDFSMLSKWCHDSGLVLNVDKTKLLHIRSPHLKHSSFNNIIAHNHNCLHASGTQCKCPYIEIVTSHTYLGLIIDSKLNWSHHIEHVCNKLRQFLANIIMLKDRIPYKVKLMLYNSLVESYIQYGLTSYGRTYCTYINNIFKLQRRILRNIVSHNIKQQFYNDDDGLFKYCKVLPVQIQLKYMLVRENFYKQELINKKQHAVYTRAVARNMLCTTGANNTYGERTTAYLLPRLLNTLPSEWRAYNSKNIKPNDLKSRLRSYFLLSVKSTGMGNAT